MGKRKDKESLYDYVKRNGDITPDREAAYRKSKKAKQALLAKAMEKIKGSK